MRGRRLVYAAVATIVIVFLMRTSRAPKPLYGIREPKPTTELGGAFDPARCGTVRGTIAWNSDVPTVPAIQLILVPDAPAGQKTVPNPNTPRPKDHRLADAIVYLKEVDPKRSHEWTLPSVAVEARATGFTIKQGDQEVRAGIVRRGETVELVSREAGLQSLGPHSIRARGAAFFTQMLPIPNQAVRRPISDKWIVELSSGFGYYWLRGYLLVTDHPYATLSATDGTFTLGQVPDGEYELICWVPNWHVEKTENDPERNGPVRLIFRPAVEKSQRITVKAGATAECTFTFAAEDFGHVE